jgi:hypothetical protein
MRKFSYVALITPAYEIIDEKSSIALFSDKKNIDKE